MHTHEVTLDTDIHGRAAAPLFRREPAKGKKGAIRAPRNTARTTQAPSYRDAPAKYKNGI